MRRYAQNAVLVLLGGVLLKLAATGTYERYASGVPAPLLMLAGLALLVIAAANLWREIRPGADSDETPTSTGLRLDGLFGSDRKRAAAREAVEANGEEDRATVHRDRALAAGRAAAAHEGLDGGTVEAAAGGAHGPTAVVRAVADEGTRSGEDVHTGPGAHSEAARNGEAARTGEGTPAGEGGVVVATPAGAGPAAETVRRGGGGGWALVAMALAVVLLSPPALGGFAATRAGTAVAVAGGDLLPPGDPVSLTLEQYAARAASGGQTLAGRQVRLVGFMLAGPLREPYLTRFVAGCCAAGARPVKIGLTGDLGNAFTPGRWVEVIGTYADRTDRDPVNGAPIPYLSVVSMTEIDAPVDTYES